MQNSGWTVLVNPPMVGSNWLSAACLPAVLFLCRTCKLANLHRWTSISVYELELSTFLVYSRYRKLLVKFHVVILIVTWCNFPIVVRVKLDSRRVSLSTAPVYKLVHMMARGVYSESWNDKEANPNSSTPTLRSKGFFGIGRSKVVASPSRPSWQSTGQGAT
ncbi:hypothetical protein F5Y02DRAFT_378982 [Annulohypoxylon stygium]|nr:hypothetical protein F5Y02DRAFT_378982 [Annulohypoxylon stygium]